MKFSNNKDIGFSRPGLLQWLSLMAVIVMICFNGCRSDDEQFPEPSITEPVDGIRIAWNYSTMTRVAPRPGRAPGYYGYARMVRLHDDRLACVYETSAGNIELTFSENEGESWMWPATVFQRYNNINMAVPSILELNDHSILIACNPRPLEPYSDDRKFGIKVRKSKDGGTTWETEQLVYEAQSTFEDGCWEPSLLQLPDGEVHLYFSNEGIYTSSNEQNISLLRSYDLGETWTDKPEIVGFRENRRDGMPVPLLLPDKGEIIVSVEDNMEGEFKPTLYHEQIDNNWTGDYIDANDPRRSYHPLKDQLPLSIYAGGPFLVMLQTGEVLLSYQTTLNRNSIWDHSVMAVEIGDQGGTLFSRRSSPFRIPLDKWGLWNSLAVIGDNTPVAVTSTNTFSDHSTEIWMIKGHIIPEYEIPAGSFLIDGSPDDPAGPADWPFFVGSRSISQLNADFRGDTDSLYVAISLYDPELIVKEDYDSSDGFIIQLDTKRIGYIAPYANMYAIHVLPDSRIKFEEWLNGDWTKTGSSKSIRLKTESEGDYYWFEMAIPWLLIRAEPSSGQRMGMNMILKNRDTNGYIFEESITSNDASKPFTWCPLILNNEQTEETN